MNTHTAAGRDAVAVVGMACRLPGAITTPHALWDALLRGRDLVTDPAPGHPRADLLPAALLDEAGLGFDAAHFGLAPAEVAAMDPQQMLLLELVEEAFQHAGIPLSEWRGRRVGLWIGSSCLDQALLRLGPGRGGTMVDTAGALPSMLAGRVSRHRLTHWRGPCETVDTACSASLVAVHRARAALACGEVDLAVVGGTNLLRLDTHTRMFRASGVLSARGRVKPFDAGADGFVRGEGAGVVVLQRSGEARAAGVAVRAVVVGSETGSDGYGTPIGAPSVQGQRELLEWTYGRTPVWPGQVDYVQCHGTGTRAGDAAEARALGRFLARDRESGPLLLGSVKANLGHLEGAAGIVGLIATVLALEHQVVPPTLGHSSPLPVLQQLGLEVPTAARAWPRTGRPATAAVQAFGFGGTNVHVVLQAPSPVDSAVPGRGEGAHESGDHLVPVSASSPEALEETAARWAGAIEERSLALGPVASTAAHRRDHHRGARAAALAHTPAEAVRALHAAAGRRADPALVGPRVPFQGRPRVVFVYPGHGAHPTGEDSLAGGEPVFAAALERAHRALTHHNGDDQSSGQDGGLGWVQPAQWAWQVAATCLLASWGVVPDAVVGHSLGEVAAATAAGALTLDGAARVVAERSRLLEQTAPAGGLLATALRADQAHALAANRPGVGVAALNADRSTVLSGPHADLAQIAARLQAERVWHRPVAGAPPAHSPLVADAAARLTDRLRGLSPASGRVAMHSTVTAAPIGGGELGAGYWGRQLRCTVHLHRVMRALAEQEHPMVVVEIGARSVLGAALADTLTRARPRYAVDPPLVAVGMSGQREHADALAALAGLYTFGLDPAWPGQRSAAVELPPRAWTHTAPTSSDQGEGQAGVLAGCTPEQGRTVIAEQVHALLAQMSPADGVQGRDLAELGLGSLALTHLHHQLLRRLPDLAGMPAHTTLACRTPDQLVEAATAHWQPTREITAAP
ncbi:type I polyketide synthase [Nocardiopsis sp. CNT312]|uniref:beta-ketoacyl synthase N-terminal-like domain-containing protein n=1 Tax=Nocardiopsis sp. CNT312 TaxID=1137268 RepID=UPI00068793E1|nr:type I polyketide synthase [Nocardiopsis sp. CNT312]